MRRRRFLLLVAGVGVIGIAAAVWVVLARGSDAPAGPPVGDVYAGMTAALGPPGMVAHVTFDSGERTDGWISSRREAWLDVANDAARERTTTTYRSPSVDTTSESGVVYREGMAYSVGEDGQRYESPFQGCVDEAVRILTLLADCPRSGGTVAVRTESGRFDGIDAIAVVIEGKLSGIDSVVEIHNRLFVDAGSFLPLGYERKGTDRYALGGYENDFRSVTRFTIAFVARESLAPNFFEPTAIGYPVFETLVPAATSVAQ